MTVRGLSQAIFSLHEAIKIMTSKNGGKEERKNRNEEKDKAKKSGRKGRVAGTQKKRRQLRAAMIIRLT